MVARRDDEARARATLSHLRRIVHTIHAHSAAIELAVGISGPQLWALREIAREGSGLSLGELARRLVVHKASAGRLVERLVARRLARTARDASDRRVVRVVLTPRGARAARRRVPGPAQADLVERLAALPSREATAIERALAALVHLLGAEDAAATPLFEDRPAVARGRSGAARPRPTSRGRPGS